MSAEHLDRPNTYSLTSPGGQRSHRPKLARPNTLTGDVDTLLSVSQSVVDGAAANYTRQVVVTSAQSQGAKNPDWLFGGRRASGSHRDSTGDSKSP